MTESVTKEFRRKTSQFRFNHTFCALPQPRTNRYALYMNKLCPPTDPPNPSSYHLSSIPKTLIETTEVDSAHLVEAAIFL